jgi:hypothetical protein
VILFDPKMNEALQGLTEALGGKYPEVGEILRKLREGSLGESEAMMQLVAIVQQRGIAKDIEGLAAQFLNPSRKQEITLLPVQEQPPAVIQKGNVIQLNPLAEAAIAEVAQFDGDVPEFRTGPLPEGVAPAVPVEAMTRSPVALGVMLGQASKEVQQEIDSAVLDHLVTVKQIESQTKGLPEETAIQVVRNQLPAAPTGVPGYEAGHVPALRKVEEPTAVALANLTPEQQHQAAWKALSTRQGRRSAVPVIEAMVVEGLRDEGVEIAVHPVPKGWTEVIYADWTVLISGEGAIQPDFAIFDTAAKVLISKVVQKFRESPIVDPVMEVYTVDAVDLRRVGWAVRVGSR